MQILYQFILHNTSLCCEKEKSKFVKTHKLLWCPEKLIENVKQIFLLKLIVTIMLKASVSPEIEAWGGE